VSDPTERLEQTITEQFDLAGCVAAWHVLDLNSGADMGVRADTPVVLASVFKVLVALEFYAQVDAGILDGAETITLTPADHTDGPTGISTFEDPVRISLRDLCRMMLSVSDNTAADRLLEVVGLEQINARARVCGCGATVVESSLREMWDRIGVDLGFSDNAELVRARAGALGPDAQRQGWDVPRMLSSAALDPMRTNRSTPRDMTKLLRAIWKDEAAAPASCASTRTAMAQLAYTRLGRALPDGASYAGKTGTLNGWLRNEIGVIAHSDGSIYAAAFFTRAHHFRKGTARIDNEIARSAAMAIFALRSPVP
jgi:beta-lactamase class A